MGEGGLRIRELGRGMSVAVEGKDAVGAERQTGQRVVDIPRSLMTSMSRRAVPETGKETRRPEGDRDDIRIAFATRAGARGRSVRRADDVGDRV